MSGIYIPGLEMPTSCAKCGWYSFIEEVCRVNRCEIPATDDVFLSRHKDCPLVPVPEHTVEPTNADRIRAMSDEELAQWIDHIQADAYERGMMETPVVDYPNVYSNWLDWLKSPVEVDNGT